MNPIGKRQARSFANWAQKEGFLDPQPCADCGASEGVDKHHQDHDHPLAVVWLCRKCHFKRHKSERIPLSLEQIWKISDLLRVGVSKKWISEYLKIEPRIVSKCVRGWKYTQLPKLLQERAGIVP